MRLHGERACKLKKALNICPHLIFSTLFQSALHGDSASVEAAGNLLPESFACVIELQPVSVFMVLLGEDRVE